MARTMIWALCSAAALLAALVAVSAFWLDFTPQRCEALFISSALLTSLYIVLLIRRAPRMIWFICLAAALIPALAVVAPCLFYLHAATEDCLHRWEASEAPFHIGIAESIYAL